MLFPILTAEYYNSEQNIIILFRKYLVDFRSETWLNLFWEYINGKSFAVRRGQTHSRKSLQSLKEKTFLEISIKY
jgi:hypothetical protein